MRPTLISKLPDVGTTIFTVMSRRARELGALNIGQGFPDYDIDPRLTELVRGAVSAGHNQYAPMEGVIELRAQIAKKLDLSYGVRVDPESEVTVTLGATEAIYDAVQAVVGPGDEAIVFDPAYDSYDPAIRCAGGRCIHVPLSPPHFRYDWDRVRNLVNDRTRLIIINTPHNPACTIASMQDMRTLAGIISNRNIFVISDEVYEHVVYDGAEHASILKLPELRERGYAVFSFGKTLHATGWRVGYAVAPPELTREMRKVHQFNTFSITNPLQQAIASYLIEKPDAWSGLAGFFQPKRDRLRAALADTPFVLPPAQGTYFQLVDFGAFDRSSGLGDRQRGDVPKDVQFAERLLTEAGIATIPLSPFYRDPPPTTLVRVCIAKKDSTLDEAASRLRAFARSATLGP